MESTPWDPKGVTVSLDPKGRLAIGHGALGLDLKVLYRALVAARCLDVRASRAALPHWTSAAGEEAALLAAPLVARSSDWIFPGLRDAAVAMARGMEYETIAANLRAGRGFGDPALRLGPSTDALGMQLALASGVALAQKLRGTGEITIASFGEGATTTGAFHETTMNAVHNNLPLVLVCRSQLWPDGAPPEAGQVGDSVADRAKTAGLWVRRVDGADPVGVCGAVSTATQRAREGRGPSLVEVVVTRLRDDTPPHRDPVERLRRHLDNTGVWSQSYHDGIEAGILQPLEEAFGSTHATSEGNSAP